MSENHDNDHKWARFKEQQLVVWIASVVKFKQRNKLLEAEEGFTNRFALSARLNVIEVKLNEVHKNSLEDYENLPSRKESVENAIRVINRQLRDEERFTPDERTALENIRNDLETLDKYYGKQIKLSVELVGKKMQEELGKPKSAMKHHKKSKTTRSNQALFSKPVKEDLTELLIDKKHEFKKRSYG